MSRLKGADLGINVPAAALNYRGAWSSAPNPAYATDDVVLRNNQLYTAITTPGTTDPASIPAAAMLASWNSDSVFAESGTAVRTNTQPFTPTAAMTIDAVALQQRSAAQWSGVIKVGIVAGAVATNTDVSTLTFLASGTLAASAFALQAWSAVSLDSPLALTAGQLYTLVVYGLNNGDNIGSLTIGDSTTTHPVATGLTIGQGLTGAALTVTGSIAGGGYGVIFQLQRLGSPWAPMGAVLENVNAVAASGAAVTLPDVFAATSHRVVLTANCTLTFPTAAAGKSFTLALVQDATGSRTVTWPATVKWAGGTAPTLTTTASKTDVLSFVCLDGTNWLGFVSGQSF